MNKNTLFVMWGGLFVLCAGLGFVPQPEGWVRPVLSALSLVFFLPPFFLLRGGSRETAALIRNLSLLSLGLTLALFVASILTAAGSERLGNFLHGVLAIVSTPMLCSGQWALSLFLWACLLMLSLKKRGKPPVESDSTAG